MNNNNSIENQPGNDDKSQSKKGVRVYAQAPVVRERVRTHVRWTWREIMNNTFKEVYRSS